MKNLFALLLLLAALLLARASRAQNIGIGTTTPSTKAALDIQSPTNGTGLLIPRLTAAQRGAIATPPQGLMVYQTDGTTSGGTQTGFWYYAGAPAAWVFLSPTPSGLTLPYSGTASTSSAAFAVANTGAGQALSGQSSSGAGVEGVSNSNSTTVGAVNGINNNTGANAVGVRGQTTAGYAVRGQATTGTGLYGSGTTGFGVQGLATGTNGWGVYGNSTSSYGVYASSTSGIALRAVGSTGAAISAQATTTSSAVTITQSGSGLALDAVGGAIRSTEVRSPGTGTANLMPICYGNVNDDGTIFSVGSSPNFTVARLGAGVYDISITGESYYYQNYTTVVSINSGSGGEIATNSVGALRLRVYTYTSAGVNADRPFCFVTYKP